MVSYSLIVRWKQALKARSTLELPPIIKHEHEHLAFVHPCLRTSPSEAESLAVSRLRNLDANLLLDLRCSFNTNVGNRKRQHIEVGSALDTTPGVPRPPSETSLARGGVLCIQVGGVRVQHPHTVPYTFVDIAA